MVFAVSTAVLRGKRHLYLWKLNRQHLKKSVPVQFPLG